MATVFGIQVGDTNTVNLSIHNPCLNLRMELIMTKERYNPNPLGVQVGDTIAVTLGAYCPPKVFVTKVTGVQRRYPTDLIYALPTDIENVLTCNGYQAFDVSWVTHIVEKSKISDPTKNTLYQDSVHRVHSLSYSFREKGYWMDSACELAHTLLEHQPLIPIEYGIDRHKLYTQWFKAGQPGKKQTEYRMLHIKTFRKWLMRNVNKVILSKKDFIKAEKEREEYEWQTYLKDIEREEDNNEDIY